MRIALLSATLGTLVVSAAGAQRQSKIWVPVAPAFARAASLSSADSSPNDVSRGVGGVIGAVGGFFIGALAGAAVEKGAGCAGDDLCGVGGAVIGGTLGEGIGMGVGVAAGGRGSRPGDVLLSTGIAVAGLAGALVAKTPYVMIAVPFVQLAVLLRSH